MKREVRVVPNSSENSISERDGMLVVRVKESPKDGRANRMLLSLLKEYFGREVRIVKGLKKRRKIVEIV